jgi:hypothetical protein
VDAIVTVANAAGAAGMNRSLALMRRTLRR